GNLDAGLEAAVNLRELTRGFQPSGRVFFAYTVETSIVLPLCADHKVPILDKYILRPARVVLQFLISPAFSPNIENPLRQVDSGIVRAVKFVAPNQFPSWLLPRGSSLLGV